MFSEGQLTGALKPQCGTHLPARQDCCCSPNHAALWSSKETEACRGRDLAFQVGLLFRLCAASCTRLENKIIKKCNCEFFCLPVTTLSACCPLRILSNKQVFLRGEFTFTSGAYEEKDDFTFSKLVLFHRH